MRLLSLLSSAFSLPSTPYRSIIVESAKASLHRQGSIPVSQITVLSLVAGALFKTAVAQTEIVHIDVHMSRQQNLHQSSISALCIRSVCPS